MLLYGEGGTVVRAWLPGASGSRAKYTAAARRRAQAVSSTATEEAPMLALSGARGVNAISKREYFNPTRDMILLLIH